MKTIINKVELKGMQDLVDEVIFKIIDIDPSADVERINLIKSMKEEVSKAVKVTELADGSLELDMDVEYILDIIEIYKDTIIDALPIAFDIFKLCTKTNMKLAMLVSKWL